MRRVGDPPRANQRGDYRREEEPSPARGLTNRRISEEFVLSERTVSAHVGRIFKKLGLRSRDEVALALERRPYVTE